MKHPVDDVCWVAASELKPNDYNPNYVAKPELDLLKISLLEDGWTQPIVCTSDHIIVDGFHRWWLATNDGDIVNLTEGYVPVATYPEKSLSDKMISTIRHNRARGVHNILSMSKIAHRLVSEGIPDKEVLKRLGMEKEELIRLTDNYTMKDYGKKKEFSKSWIPTFSTDGDEDIL